MNQYGSPINPYDMSTAPYMQPMVLPAQQCSPYAAMPAQQWPTQQWQTQSCGPQAVMQAHQQYPSAHMQIQQLETMYPRVYHVVMPEIDKCCDEIDMQYGYMHCPTKAEMDAMVDKMYVRVEKDVDRVLKEEYGDDRQFGYAGRGLLRGLLATLLIRQLIRRRFPFYSPYPFYGVTNPFYPGYLY